MQHSYPKKNSGFSLVEVMVALLLGLIILLAIYVTLITNLHSLSTTEAQGALGDNGRKAVSFLQQQLKQAGYRSFKQNVEDVASSYFLPNNWELTDWQNSEFVRIKQGTSASGDELYLRYYGETENSQIGIQDCIGGAVHENQAIEIRIKVNGQQQLTCESHLRGGPAGWSDPVVVAEGIETLQLRHTEQGPSVSYNTAAPADWRDVNRVQFAILVRSSELTASGITNNKTYDVLDTQVTSPGDRYLRAVHERSVSLRNIRIN